MELTLQGKKVVITAGPTYEPIDPVRFIGNHSTGKMGYELAQYCQELGAEVTIVSGPVALNAPVGVEVIKVMSAKEMLAKVQPLALNADVVILAAAVADYTPKHVSDIKIKKKEDTFSIELVKNPDIAQILGQSKKQHQIHVGFALETNNEFENAFKKLKSKNLDFIVLNSLQNKGTCFGSDDNKIIIIEENKSFEFELKSKKEVSKDIIRHLCEKIN